MSKKILELSMDEVARRFDGPEEFAEAVVEEKKEEFQEKGLALSEEQKDNLYDMYMRSVKEDEIWS